MFDPLDVLARDRLIRTDVDDVNARRVQGAQVIDRQRDNPCGDQGLSQSDLVCDQETP